MADTLKADVRSIQSNDTEFHEDDCDSHTVNCYKDGILKSLMSPSYRERISTNVSPGA
jgi:hypothetical protein